jgi:hypothetical protein
MICYPIRALKATGIFFVTLALVLCVVRRPSGWAQSISTDLALDVNGWPIFKAQPNSRIIYVSSSTGKDYRDGLSPATAIATIAKGVSRLRNGYPDQLLLKAGDTFVDQSFGTLKVNGESAAAPIVIGTYGFGDAPVVETNPNQDGGVAIANLPGKGGNFIVVEGINFYAYTRDPNNAAYAGPNKNEVGANFLNPNTWVALVGDKFSYFSTDVIFQASSSNVTPSTLILYRDVITDSWSTTGHSQGLFVAGVANLVIEQSTFDHNGWNAQIPGAAATIFNRNVYLQYNNGPVRYLGNISANSASEGAQFRSGGTIVGNVFVADSAGFDVGENTGSTVSAQGQVVPIPAVTFAVASGNVILNSNDIQASSGRLPRGKGINILNAFGSNVRVTNNIIAHPSSQLVNQSGVSLNSNVSGITVTNNIIYEVAHPVVDLGMNNTTSSNSTSSFSYVDPSRTVETYNTSLGGDASLSAFLVEARKQSKNNWRMQYTAEAIITYIQAGFHSSERGR